MQVGEQSLARIDLTYVDGLGNEAGLRQGFSRLRSFFLRNAKQSDPLHWIAGTHLTASDRAMQVSEAISSVQVPVIFESEVHL